MQFKEDFTSIAMGVIVIQSFRGICRPALSEEPGCELALDPQFQRRTYLSEVRVWEVPRDCY